MNIFLYIIFFIIGSVLGALCSVKSREIPKELDLKETVRRRKDKKELISELIYILIGGLSSVLLANILRININDFDISKLTTYIFGITYIYVLMLIAGIDRIYTKIDKKTLASGVVFSIIYMVYLFVIDVSSANMNIIYLIIYIILLLTDSFLLKKFAKDSYIINIMILLNILLVFTDIRVLISTLFMSIIAITIYILIIKMQKNKKIKIDEIPVGFFIASSNIITLLLIRVVENFLI